MYSKIAFFANVYSETSFFRTAGEEKSDHASSGYKYKGRGIQQLTGDGSAPVAYKAYNEKVPEDIETYPELVATKLHLAVDSGGWFWSIYKKIPTWKENPRGNYSQAEKDAMKFKREYFSKALGKTLNEASLLMEDDEERYYYLICKILNGYTLSHKLEVDPNGWDARKTGLSKLKTWFKYDKNICKDGGVMPNLKTEGWHEPVDNPQIVMYMQSGGYWPKYASFGLTRTQTRASGVHQGLDLFAIDDGTTKAYACLSGKVVFAGTAGAYGKMVILEISKPDQLEIFKKRKRNYSLRYANNGEKNQGSGFVDTGNIYIKYAHLREIKVAENVEIDAGVVVGIAGTSGVPGGTCGPHVHFEIASSESSSGLTNRVNPGFYVYYKNENEMTEAEKKNQENRKNIGKR